MEKELKYRVDSDAGGRYYLNVTTTVEYLDAFGVRTEVNLRCVEGPFATKEEVTERIDAINLKTGTPN